MKISTRGRYALRMMLDLALHYNGEYIKIKHIAERQQVSNKYLEQIIPQLTKSGFVRSSRGAQGGYMLTSPPESYTVGMILRLIEGNLAPVSCLDTPENPCPRAKTCVTLDVWHDIQKAVDQVVDNITLADLVVKWHAKNDDPTK